MTNKELVQLIARSEIHESRILDALQQGGRMLIQFDPGAVLHLFKGISADDLRTHVLLYGGHDLRFKPPAGQELHERDRQVVDSVRTLHQITCQYFAEVKKSPKYAGLFN